MAAALPFMQTASIAFGFATNSRKVFQLIKEIAEVDRFDAQSELVELYLMLVSIQGPFRLVCQINTREEYIEMTNPSVIFAKTILRKCESFLESREKFLEDIDEEESSEYWGKIFKKWLSNEKKQQMKSLCNSLGRVANLISLALTAVTLRYGQFDPKAEIGVTPKNSFKKAEKMVFEFESGRINHARVAAGRFLQYMETPVKRSVNRASNDLVEKGYCNITLMKKNLAYTLSIKFDNEEAEEFSLYLHSLEVHQLWLKNIDEGILCNSEVEEYEICLEFRQKQRRSFLIFDVSDGISCQTFQAVVKAAQAAESEEVGKVSAAVSKIKLIDSISK